LSPLILADESVTVRIYKMMQQRAKKAAIILYSSLVSGLWFLVSGWKAARIEEPEPETRNHKRETKEIPEQ
jgi:hypothetical protein